MVEQVIVPWMAGSDSVFVPRFEVKIEKGVWVDDQRGGRSVPYKLYLPAGVAGGRFPVIIWSHGLGGSRDGAGFISRAVAGHGYAVLHVQHVGTDSSLWEGKPGHPWDVIRATPISRRATLQRLQDVPFALDQLQEMAATDAGAVLDMNRIGMSGHSFGAMTTQVMAGQTRGFGTRCYRLRDPRFSAGILYSPVPVRQKYGQPPQHFYGSIDMPLFVMTGTDDASPIEGFGYEHRMEVFDYSGGPEQSLLVLNDGDHMVYNGSRGKLESNPKRDIHENAIVTGTLAYWDAYLKGDEKAKQWLTGGGFASYLGHEGEYRFRL